MITNAVTVFDLWPFLVMAKGPARQPGADLLSVQKTAADQSGRGDLLMKMIIKILQEIIVVLSTIVVNQSGELVPDRTEVIHKLLRMHTELEEAKHETI